MDGGPWGIKGLGITKNACGVARGVHARTPLPLAAQAQDDYRKGLNHGPRDKAIRRTRAKAKRFGITAIIGRVSEKKDDVSWGDRGG